MADRRLALVLFFLVPATFASNMLTARAVAGDIPPVALAFWRWTLTLAILTPFVAGALWRGREELRRDWRGYLFLGFLGMGFAGPPSISPARRRRRRIWASSTPPRRS